MEEIAPDLHILSSRPAHAFNVYLAGGVLIDASTRWAWRRIRRSLNGHAVHAHALTHAHPDHQGASARACKELNIPFWVGARDAEIASRGGPAVAIPRNPVTFVQGYVWAGPGHPVDRELHEGDEVGGFTVIETPGHQPGHIAFWREHDRVLIAGDVFFGRHPITGRPGVFSPPDQFTIDPESNRESQRRLAALRPELVVFGHGPPVQNPEALAEFVAASSG